MPFTFNRYTFAPKSRGKLNYKAVFECYGNQFHFARHLTGSAHKLRSDIMPQNNTLPDNEMCKRTNNSNYPFPKR